MTHEESGARTIFITMQTNIHREYWRKRTEQTNEAQRRILEKTNDIRWKKGEKVRVFLEIEGKNFGKIKRGKDLLF